MKIDTSYGRSALWLGAVSLLSVLLAPSSSRSVRASDHVDAPSTEEDPSVDIGDFYAWHTERGTLVAILTFNPGLPAFDPGSPPDVYDPDVLYTIHIDNTATIAENNDVFDNDNDNESDIRIHVRFGQNQAGAWGVQFLDVPGANGPIVGPVQAPLSSGSVQAIAGIFDDPFFFDIEGSNATLAGMLDDTDPQDIEFQSLQGGQAVDGFAGSNTLAIAVEFDLDLALDNSPDDFLQLWATTGRP